MNVELAIIAAFGLLFLLLALGVPIAWAMMFGGFLGCTLTVGLSKGLSALYYHSWSVANMEMLVCIPLFLIMGRLAFESGLAAKIFSLASSLVGRLKGGLAMAVALACGAFGAVSGSVAAALSTLGPTAIPEMNKFHYNKQFSATVIACSSTFASMIPPSLALIIYGWVSETSIAKLFIAGIVPGIVTIVFYCITIYIMVSRNPSLAPQTQPNVTWHQRGRLTLSNLPLMIVVFIAIGGIYLGWFTPTESSAIGAFLVFVLAVASRGIGLKGTTKSFLAAGRIAAMLIFILIGAKVFATFAVITGVPTEASKWIASLGLNPYMLIMAIFILYLVWGATMESIAMIVLTVPILIPMVKTAGWDPIWFGIFCVKCEEIAHVTPPVGFNLFTIEAVTGDPDVRVSGVIRYVTPFIIADFAVIVLITIFPQICLWLPNTMG